METKNKLYFIYDKENNTIINCFTALDHQIAKKIVKDQIDKNLKILKYSKNAQEIATIECFLENQKNHELYEAFSQTKIEQLSNFIPKIKIKENKQ